ncbi:hypothetical protein [Streptomyces sp. SID4985]|uniref:hypothetical protein n=1 Tax=Streptomyces sp. SID4985 TaxID=2690292 RepID=UPI001F33AFAD|nr:hypothetical protein [Streptomyces sp. SID4985]
MKRDAEAWKHAEVFLDHGPEVLAGVRAAADGPDYVEGPISDDLRRLRGIDATLERARQVRNEWDQIMALMEASQPGSLQLYQEQAEEHRNAEGWHYADELSYRGPALVRVAEHLADRADARPASQTERARVALTRSAPALVASRSFHFLFPQSRTRRPPVVPADAPSAKSRQRQTGRSPDPRGPPHPF